MIPGGKQNQEWQYMVTFTTRAKNSRRDWRRRNPAICQKSCARHLVCPSDPIVTKCRHHGWLPNNGEIHLQAYNISIGLILTIFPPLIPDMDLLQAIPTWRYLVWMPRFQKVHHSVTMRVAGASRQSTKRENHYTATCSAPIPWIQM